MAAPNEQPIQIFISYSHEDEKLREKLSAHLAAFKRRGLISEWHDRMIPAGGDWAREIDERLNQSRIILLLISSDFIASDYCQEIEMRRALERHQAREAVVIPVILRDCIWDLPELNKLQALPKNAQPVTTWPDPDAGFKNAAEGIGRIIERMRERLAIGESLGESVFRLCDRDSQREDFDDFLHDNQNAQALVCAIPAEQHGLPLSMVDSFCDTIIRDYARKRWGKTPAAIPHKMIEWPSPGDLEKRRRRLLHEICRELGCDERADSPRTFVDAFASRLEKVIVLSHDLSLENWGKGDRELAQSYMTFWDEVNRRGPAPQFVVFLNLLYPEKQVPSWRSFLTGSGFNRDLFETQAREMFARNSSGCPKIALAPLGCVEKKHVKRWFDRHKILDEGERITKIDELFRDRNCLSMKEVQPFLKKYHEQYVAER
ncbi:MAG: TIR domain-containing protein [Blastocatellia bacterium]